MKLNKEILKIRNIYGVIRKKVEIVSGSKDSIDKELAYDLIRWGYMFFNWCLSFHNLTSLYIK